jgi:hypothetical protein
MGFTSTTYGVSFEFEGFADATKASEVSEGSVVDFFEGFFAVIGVLWVVAGSIAGIGVFEGYATASEENLLI